MDRAGALVLATARRLTSVIAVSAVMISVCACSPTKEVVRPSPSTPGSSTTSTSEAASPSALAAGTLVPGYKIQALSFISETEGFGLFESNGITSSAQQLAVTDNGGMTWKVAAPTVLPAWASTLEFVDATTGYAWSYDPGDEELEITRDGGAQWTDALTITGGYESVSVVGSSVWALGSSGVVETSSDAGISWQHAFPLPLSNASVIARPTATVAFVLSCSLGSMAATENGGQSWTSFTVPACRSGDQGADLVAASPDDLWMVEFGQPATDMSSKWVYQSTDGGAEWSTMAVQELGNPSLNQGTISAIGDFGPLVVPSGHGRAWLAEDRGGLLVTTDGGVTWSPVFNDTSEADTFGPPFVSFFGTTQGWAATGYGLWHTTDGVDWSDIVPAPASSG